MYQKKTETPIQKVFVPFWASLHFGRTSLRSCSNFTRAGTTKVAPVVKAQKTSPCRHLVGWTFEGDLTQKKLQMFFLHIRMRVWMSLFLFESETFCRKLFFKKPACVATYDHLLTDSKVTKKQKKQKTPTWHGSKVTAAVNRRMLDSSTFSVEAFAKAYQAACLCSHKTPWPGLGTGGNREHSSQRFNPWSWRVTHGVGG